MPSATPPASGFLVLAAAGAGGTDGRAIGQVLEVLASAAPTQLRKCSSPRELQAALDDLAGRRLVVAGGDGTLHLVVRALLARGLAASTPVGVVPLGTGNDLARALGLPVTPAEAAARVLEGRERRLDVLCHDGSAAINAAHAGFGVSAALRAQRLKPLLGVAGYRVGGVWTGAVERGVEVTVAVDDEHVVGPRPALLVAVMNGRSIGGNAPLCPAADLCDGLLDVIVVTDRARLARAAFATALLRGRHLPLPGVVHRQGRHVRVHGAGDSWNVDGEIVPTPPVMEWSVAPSAWTVLV